MKSINKLAFALILLLGLSAAGWAEDKIVPASPETNATSAATDTKAVAAEPAEPAAVKPAENASSAPVAPVEVAAPTVSAPPAAPLAEPAAPNVSASSAAAPAVGVSSAAPAAVAVSTPAAAAVTPQAVVAVPQLQALTAYHESEIASLKKFTERWNKDMGGVLQKRQDTNKSIAAMTEKMDALQKQNTRASRKEADQLKKQIANQNKVLRTISDELRAKNRVLSDEVRNLSSQTQQSTRAAYQAVVTDLQNSRN